MIVVPTALLLDRMQVKEKRTEAKESLCRIVFPTFMKTDNELANITSEELKHCTPFHSSALSNRLVKDYKFRSRDEVQSCSSQ